MTTKVTELLQVLADRGLSDDAIINVRDGMLAQANETFMTDVLAALTDEDLQIIETATTQEEANQQLVALYHEKTGRDMPEEIVKIVDQYADNLIAKYKMNSSEPLTTVVTEGNDGFEQAPSDSLKTDEETKHTEDDTIHDLT